MMTMNLKLVERETLFVNVDLKIQGESLLSDVHSWAVACNLFLADYLVHPVTSQKTFFFYPPYETNGLIRSNDHWKMTKDDENTSQIKEMGLQNLISYPCSHFEWNQLYVALVLASRHVVPLIINLQNQNISFLSTMAYLYVTISRQQEQVILMNEILSKNAYIIESAKTCVVRWHMNFVYLEAMI